MSNEDREAARELAADLGYGEAAKFLRSQIGYGLRDAIREVEHIAFERPASRLAESIRARDAASSPSPQTRSL